MDQEQKIAVIIAAAGSGTRMVGDLPKQYLDLAGMPVLARSIKAFEDHPLVDEICVVVRKEDCSFCQEQMVQPFAFQKVCKIVAGGIERQDSVHLGLKSLSPDVGYVLIHDGARPLIETDTITRLIEQVKRDGACAAGVPVKDTIKITRDEKIINTPDRRELFAIQTPQAFRLDLLLTAFDQAREDGYIGTDETVLLERLGKPVTLVKGSYRNLKITTREDMIMAAALLQEDAMQRQEDARKKTEVPASYRTGIGYDVHRLVQDRKLILGGVEIPHDLGLLGHSDADVLVHSIMDALLGAAAMGDIGKHFPDHDPAYKSISSLRLLERVGKIVCENGYRIGNIDATLIAERPKISTYIPMMVANIALTLDIPENCVSVKATTTEGLGFCGRQEGIGAQAAVLLYIG